MSRILIVNADDCNLTPGVTDAILDCHENGIVSSTTFLINLYNSDDTLRRLKKYKRLGIGLHLNVTLGTPVTAVSKIGSLLSPRGGFKKVGEQLRRPPKIAELLLEYESQIRLFNRFFGTKPTHLDTHHHLHDHPAFFKALAQAAKKYQLPVRRSAVLTGLKTTDFFFGNLNPEGYWREEALVTLLKNFPTGVSEIMCHPGKNDRALALISSFREGRAAEHCLFRSPSLRRLLSQCGITLTHFGL